MQITDDPVRFETYADILTRHGLDELTIEGESAPPGETSSASMIVQAGRFIPYTAPSTGTRVSPVQHDDGLSEARTNVYDTRRNDPPSLTGPFFALLAI